MLRQDQLSPVVLVFRSRWADRVQLLVWDGRVLISTEK
jgi:hypothetical protein